MATLIKRKMLTCFELHHFQKLSNQENQIITIGSLSYHTPCPSLTPGSSSLMVSDKLSQCSFWGRTEINRSAQMVPEFDNELIIAIGVLITVIIAGVFCYFQSFKVGSVPFANLSMLETIDTVTSYDSPLRIHNLSFESGSTFRLLLPQLAPVIVCTEWKVAKEIYKDDLSDKPDFYKVFDLGTGCPVLVSKKTSSPGPSGWAMERKAFAGYFVKSKYDVDVLHKRLAELDEILNISEESQDGEVDATELMVRLMIDVFGESALGIDMKGLSGAPSGEVSLGRIFLEEMRVVMRQSTQPWRRYMGSFLPDVKIAIAARERLIAVGEAIVENGRMREAEPGFTPSHLLSKLLNYPFPEERYRPLEAILFLTGGYDTTGYTLAWTLFELARNPEEQSALALELTQEEHPSRLERVVNEAMRLWPVASGGGLRTASKDFTTKDFYTIKKGSKVSFNQYSMHRQPWIRNANKFIPDRWRNEDPQVDELRKSFMPFGFGRRNCIGQTHALLSIKFSTAHLVREYEWSVVQEPKPMFFLTLKPEGLRLKVKSRSSRNC